MFQGSQRAAGWTLARLIEREAEIALTELIVMELFAGSRPEVRCGNSRHTGLKVHPVGST